MNNLCRVNGLTNMEDLRDLCEVNEHKLDFMTSEITKWKILINFKVFVVSLCKVHLVIVQFFMHFRRSPNLTIYLIIAKLLKF